MQLHAGFSGMPCEAKAWTDGEFLILFGLFAPE